MSSLLQLSPPRRRVARVLRFTPLTAVAALGLCLAVSACDDETTPSGTSGGDGGTPEADGGSAETSTPSNKNSVDLVITGDITATLKGAAGTCGGVGGGASFQVRSEELGVEPPFRLAVVILSEPDWATPPTVLNVTGGASYVWNKANGTIVAQRDRSRVDIDAELSSVGSAGKIKIKGSIVCGP